MKRWFAYACATALAVVLLASCASFPAPQGDKSSLVVGNFRIDFPDGFFDRPPLTINERIRVKISDLTAKTHLTAFTSNGGYFYFAAKPGDQYRLDSWDVSVYRGNHTYKLGPGQFGYSFQVVPGKVIYLGDLTYIHKSPKKILDAPNRSNWRYDISASSRYDPDGVHKFIQKMKNDSAWLNYRIMPTVITDSNGKKYRGI